MKWENVILNTSETCKQDFQQQSQYKPVCGKHLNW